MPVPFTEIRTSHAVSIRANNKTIGRITQWSPSQARDVKLKFEINATGTGAPLEGVPGVATSQTIQIARYDLYTSKMEEIWGFPQPLYMLTDQHNPIDIEEKWVKFGKKGAASVWGMPVVTSTDILNKVGSTGFGKALGVGTQNELEGIDTGATPGKYEVSVEKFWYSGCWFTSLGRVLQSQGDRIVLVNATLVFTKFSRLL